MVGRAGEAIFTGSSGKPGGKIVGVGEQEVNLMKVEISG